MGSHQTGSIESIPRLGARVESDFFLQCPKTRRLGHEESGDLVLILARQNAAGRVDEFATRLHHARVAEEDLGLEFLQTINLSRTEFPFGVGISTENSESGAWRVEQNTIGITGQSFDGFGVLNQTRLDDVGTTATGTFADRKSLLALRGVGPEFEAGSLDFHARMLPDGALRVKCPAFWGAGRAPHPKMPSLARG